MDAPAAAPGPRPWTAIGPRNAPGLVFLHSARLSRSMWWPQLRRLSGSFRCVALDLPGHGALAAEPFTIDAAVAAVCAAIEAEIPSGKAILVGLSMGGYVAIDTADAHPDRVAGLVLAGCSAEIVGPSAWPFRVFRWFLRHVPPTALDVANRAFFRIRYRAAIANPIIEGRFWPDGGAAAVDVLLGRPYLERLSRLWAPVLIVNGALDPVFGPQGEYWAASCRQGRHAVVPVAMHLSNLDRPTTYSRLVAAFASRVARDA